MIISAKIVWKPRTARRCGCCDKLIRGSACRLYGAAEGDKPHLIYCHPTPECAGGGDKVRNLLVLYDSERAVRLLALNVEKSQE